MKQSKEKVLEWQMIVHYHPSLIVTSQKTKGEYWYFRLSFLFESSPQSYHLSVYILCNVFFCCIYVYG